MIKVDRIQISGLANALYGMRLPKRSHSKADTIVTVFDKITNEVYETSVNDVNSNHIELFCKIGSNDLNLGKTLVLAGSDHGKWLRQVNLSMLITAPMTFWWDYDTYKVATTKNSSSRMHKITSRLLDEYDFAWDDLEGNIRMTEHRMNTIDHLNHLITLFNDPEVPKPVQDEVFRELINDLPDSFLFTALWTGSAKTARDVYWARRNHKQLELREFSQVLANLPTIGEFIICE